MTGTASSASSSERSRTTARLSRSSGTSRRRQPNYLTFDSFGVVHDAATRFLARDEPIPRLEEVNRPLLEAALDAPRQSVFGRELYPRMADKSAVLLYGLVKNHPWPNGNKRLALVGTLVFLGINGLWWDASNEEVYALLTFVAASEAACHDQVKAYLRCYLARRTIPYPHPLPAEASEPSSA